MRIETKEKITARKHVHVRGLGSRLALLVLFSALSIAGIAVGAALDIRKAVLDDTAAATERLAPLAQAASRGFLSDARKALNTVGMASQGGQNCTAAATLAQQADARIVAIGFATPTGAVMCGSSSGAVVLREHSFFRRTLSSRTFSMGDYVFDADTDTPTVGFAQPVFSGADVAGAAFLLMNVRGIDVSAVTSALPAGAAFGITDARAIMLVRTPEPDRWAGKFIPEDDLLNEMLSQKRGVATLKGEDGVRRLYAFAPLAGVSAPGGYVYVGIPTDTAYASVRNAAYRAAAIAVPLMLLALWAAMTLGDLLVLRRIRRLVEAMRGVVAGDGTTPDDVPGGMGELDELTAVFEKMHGKLQDTLSTTDLRVLTRTADLEFNKGMAELEKARTEALLSSIGEGVLATDKEGKIIFINHEVERALGWLAADMVGKREEEAIVFLDENGKPMPVAERPVRVALTTGQKAVLATFPKPHHLVRKDGSKYPVNVTVTPVAFGSSIIGAIEVIRDITDETEFDNRKTEFISIASHQLRTPLAATKWLSDMLRKGDVGKLDEKQQALADKLFDANERMVVLVNELLNVSRLDSGVAKPTPEPTDMVALLEGVMLDATPVLAGKKQTFAFDKKPMPSAMVDPFLIREVFANLVSNASKYSKDGGVVVIGMEAKNGELTVSVKDDGIGIPKADQSQLFKKFFRAGNALKSAVQGTGLGLYFVKSVVEMSGGKIWFDSVEQQGTTFFVTLPIATTQAPASTNV